jgi:homoserine kinase type II
VIKNKIMAVYTKINFLDLANHLKNYAIGELQSYQEIVEGIDNSNFIINTSKGKFILTIFESRINSCDLPFFINLKLHLAKKHICCPCPVINNHQQVISEFKNKESVIVSFLSGKTLTPSANGYYQSITIKHCQEVAKILAKMHLAVDDFKGNRINDLAINNFRNLFNKFANRLDDFQLGLKDQLSKDLTMLEDLWQKNYQPSMPIKACHLDLFPDNVFFDQDHNLSAVIDFYFAGNELLIYDLAIIINAWCFDEINFNQQKYLAIVNYYQQLRILNEDEQKFLPIALACASMRFLLTRLHDYFFTDKNSLVKIKDPKEYLMKLNYFKNQLLNHKF